jgi:hypothetical protein
MKGMLRGLPITLEEGAQKAGAKFDMRCFGFWPEPTDIYFNRQD